MKKKIIIVLSIVGVFGIATYFVLNFICEIGVKCKNCSQTSTTKEESIKNEFYLMDYQPLKPVIQLRHSEETITFKEVWVESQWFYNSNICLNTKLEKRDGYNIVFEFNKSNEGTFLFTLSPIVNGTIDKTNGGILENKKEIRLSNLTDTLWLQIHEKNPKEGIGWRGKLDGKRIGFIKK